MQKYRLAFARHTGLVWSKIGRSTPNRVSQQPMYRHGLIGGSYMREAKGYGYMELFNYQLC
jgi:hypothetical protein